MKKIEKKKIVKGKDFFKPIVVNDWGAIGYFEHATKSDYGTWSLKDQPINAKLRPNERVKVLWPDKTQTNEKLVGRVSFDDVHDGGHTDTVTNTLLVVVTDVRGVKVDIPIEDLYLRKLI